MPIYAVLQKLDHRLLEASQDLGATRWQTFLRITLPLSMNGIQTGLLLVFIPAFGEFVIPMIMGGSRYMYVGSTITHYLLHAHSEQIGAAFTIISGLTLCSAIIVGGIYLHTAYHATDRR
jgi:spermidine/putrescine transport system permease protein